MNILYLADPNSIHDIKWMSYFSLKKEFTCSVIVRRHHFEMMSNKDEFETAYNLKIIGVIDDFSVIRILRSFNTSSEIKKLIKYHSIDLFHIMYAEPNTLWALFKREFKLPIVLTSRGTDVLKTIPAFALKRDSLSRIVLFLYKKAFENIDQICSTSIRQIDSIKKHFHVKKEICHLIRTGVDVTIQESTHSNPHHKPYIFFPRLMKPIYNHELVLNAIIQLPESEIRKYNFIFVGKNGNDKTYIEQFETLVNKHPHSDKIIIKDTLQATELHAHYQHASLIVMTPLSDGSPVSALEAMLFKKPLLLPDLPYDEDLFGNIEKYKSGNALSLSSKIYDLLTLNNEKALDHNAEIVLNLANRQIEMKKLSKLYDSII